MVDEIAELDDVVVRLGDTPLPFELLWARPVDTHVEVTVAMDEIESATRYFRADRLRRPDGVEIDVEVVGSRREGFLARPDEPRELPQQIDLAPLVGMEVHQAATLANRGGWLVRATQPGVPITADLRSDRLNLMYGTNGTVFDAHFG